MNRAQILWAQIHDWFIKDNGDGSITCIERWSFGPDTLVTFSEFQKLRDWAGY